VRRVELDDVRVSILNEYVLLAEFYTAHMKVPVHPKRGVNKYFEVFHIYGKVKVFFSITVQCICGTKTKFLFSLFFFSIGISKVSYVTVPHVSDIRECIRLVKDF